MKARKSLTFFLLLCFLQVSTNAFAFLSPATLSLVAAAVGPSVWALLAVAGVNLLVFIKKLSKFKILIWTLTLLFLSAIGIYYAHQYSTIKKMNDDFDNVPLLKYEVDLNTIPMDQLSKYILFYMKTYAFNSELTPYAISLKDSDLDSIFDNFPEFKKTHHLIEYKNKNILIICQHGDMSSSIVEVLRAHGYKAFWARLSRTWRSEVINKYFNLPSQPPSTSLIIVPYSGQTNTAYLHFHYITHYNYELLGSAESIDPENFSKNDLEGKTIICLSNFQCLLTKYALDAKNITDRKIYKIPMPPEDYVYENGEKYLGILREKSFLLKIGTYGFFAAEFKAGQTPEAALAAIKADGFTVTDHGSALQTLDALLKNKIFINELLARASAGSLRSGALILTQILIKFPQGENLTPNEVRLILHENYPQAIPKSNAQEIYEWLMKNGYFYENSGDLGHLRPMTDALKKNLKKHYPEQFDKIWPMLQ